MAAAFLAAATVGIAGLLPAKAHAVYVPSIGDSLVYSASHASGTEAFPEAMALGPGGSIFYAHSDYNRPPELPSDPSNYVIGLSSVGSEIFRVGSADDTVLMWPCAMDVGLSDDLVVADTEHHRIVKYDIATGDELLSFGSYGSEALQFSSPSGVTVGADGTIWVADTYNDRVQHFTAGGLYLGEWSTGAGTYPDGLVTDSDGNLWVTLSGANSAVKYSPAGTVLLTIGTWYERDAFGNPTVSDQFWGPRDVAIDPWGAIYVADTENGRVVRFAPNGDWLGTYNPSGTLSKAGDVDVDTLGNVFVTDYSNDAIYEFTFVPAEVDETPPVTTSNIPADWTNAVLDVTLQSIDASNAIEAIYYSTDGNDPTTLYQAPFTVSAEGTTTVKYHAVDTAQNVEEVKTEYLRIDLAAPETTVSVPAVTYGYSTFASMNATDTLSGLKRIVYILDNGFPAYYSTPFPVLGVGNHYIDYYSQDNAGNTELIRRINFVIEAPDTAPPISTSNISAGWVNLNQSVEITATDDVSGVAATYFSSDGSNPTQLYSSPIPVTTEGITTFKFYSVDHRGNVEPVKTNYVKLDKTKPSSSSSVQSSYVDSATVTFSGTDAVSGVLNIAASLDGDPWDYSGSVHTDEWGSHTIVWRATDYAGNQETLHSATFTVLQPDNEPPITADNISSGWTQGPYTIELTSYDVISSVEGIYYSTDGSFPSTLYTGPFDFNTEGSHEIKFFAVDTRGNAENVQTRTLQIDNTAPVSVSNAQSDYLGQADITLTASDNLSTINGLWYRLDGGSWVKGASGVVVSTMAVGAHTLDYYAVDAASNTEGVHTANFTITPPDTVPPVTTFIGPASWVKGPVTAMLQAVDTSSAIAGTWYSVDGSTPSIIYGGSITIGNEGLTTVKYRSADVWSNLEDVKSSVVRIDNSAPVTTSNALSTYVDLAVITLSPTDALSGVSTTKYRIDGGAWQTGTEINVTGYWTHTVQWYSTDAVNNAETVKSATFTIRRQDRTYYYGNANILYRGTWSPGYSGAANKTDESGAAAWFYCQASRIRYVATKAADAGILRISIDGGPWVYVDLYNSYTNTWQYVFDSGDIDFDYHLVRVEHTGTQNAGSSGTAVNLDGLVIEGSLLQVPDDTAPVTTSNIDSAWQHGPVTVTLAATDATTGVQATYYSTNGAAPTTPYVAPVQITAEGTTQFKYYSVDKRGNAETVQTQSVRIDDSVPITSLPGNMATSYTTTTTVNLTPADPYSGVAYTKWRIDGGAWNTGTAVVIPGASLGSHLIEWYSADNLGHEESIKSTTVAVLARHEQTDATMLYRGTWPSSSGAGVSGGTFRQSVTAGSSFYLTFQGTRLDWISSKGSAMGKANVVLDGGAPVSVDLYNLVAQTQQRVWTTGELANGTHTLRIDYTGTKNASSTGYAVMIDAIDVVGSPLADTTAPVTTTDANSAWRTTATTVSLASSDANSWVTNSYYRLNGGAQTAYSVPFSVSAQGTNTIEYWSVDGAGNAEAHKNATVRIDGGLPTATDDAPTAWVQGPVSLTLSASDPVSGVDRIEYSTDGSAPSLLYAGPLTISDEGTTTVRYRPTDVAGNTGIEQQAVVRVDDTAPVTDMVAPPAWSIGPVTVDLSASDPLSGIETTYYRLDGGDPVAYGAPFDIETQGVTTVEYWSVDAAGNAETPHSATVRVDGGLPTATDDAPTAWVQGPVSLTLSASDPVSGVDRIEYSTDGSAPSLLYAGPLTISDEGTTTVRYRPTDVAGNTGIEQQAVVRVDDTAPGVWTDAPAGWVNQPVLCSVFAADSLSGLQVVSSSLDGEPFGPYLGPIPVASEGVHYLAYGAVDAAGNASAPVTDTVSIDLTAPQTISDAVPFYTDSATISLAANDSLSGVAMTSYRLDGGSWAPGASVTTGVMGAHSLEFRSVDVAGNVEETQSVTFSVTTRSEQDADGIYYKNNWSTENGEGLSGGSQLLTDDSGAYALFHFTGTHVDLIGSTGPSYGKARIVLDGVEAGYADLYDETPATGRSLFTLAGLTDGPHTLRVEWSGTMNAASSGTSIAIDAVDLIGVLAPDVTAPSADGSTDEAWRATPAPTSLSATDTDTWIDSILYRVDGGAPLTYSAPFAVDAEGVHTVEYWAVDAAGNASTHGNLTVRNDQTAPVTTSDAKALYTSAANIALTPSDPLSGVASTHWRVDGGAWSSGTVATVAADQLGTHTVEWYSVDNVGNAETVKSVTIKIVNRYEQDDPFASYTGTWSLSSDAAMSGGNARFTAVGGNVIDVAFTGTSMEWIGPKGPSYGLAKVTLDGTTETIVDLYAASLAYKQVVWSSGAVTNGPHTVRIECLGQKGLGSGNGVTVDALDVVGTLSARRYEQDNATVSYSGTWASNNDAYFSGGSYKFSSVTGSTMDVTFWGKRIDWVAAKGGSYGIAKVTLDGVETNVDLYNSGIKYKQSVWSSGTLSDGRHTLRIEVTGTKNAGSAGTGINIDSLDVVGYPTPVRFEQDDAKASYTGTWSSNSDGSMSGGTYRFSSVGSSFVDVSFWGKRIDWIAAKGGSYGIAKVTLDGVETDVDLYNNGLKYKQTVWSSGNITEGRHTLRIEVTGTKNASSSGIGVNVDSFDVVGQLQPRRYEQDYYMSSFAGTWAQNSDSGMSGGTYKFTSVTSSTADVTFWGKSIDWVAAKGGSYGIAKVTLDGVETNVDLYNNGLKYRQTVWSSGTLTDGRHTLRIEATGLKNGASAGTGINVDSLDVVGYVIPRRFEQNDALTSYQSTWTQTNDGGMSGGSYRHSTTAGAAINLTFTGTGVSWIGAIGPNYGMAKVTVDGTNETTVDLYNTALRYKQTIWNVAGLADGTHTLRIEVLGQKRPAAGSTAVNIDALDVVHALSARRYEQDDTTVGYAGTWQQNSDAGMYGGTYKISSTTGSSVTLTFSGKRISWIGAKGPNYGIATVSVDGGPPTSVDLYYGSLRYKQVLWDSGALTDGTHTVRFEVTGNKNASSGGRSVVFDAFDIVGTALQVDTNPPVTGSDVKSSYVSGATIVLSPVDTGAGVAATYHRLDGGAWTAGTTISTSAIGSHTIEYYSVDRVGNTEVVVGPTQFAVLARYEEPFSAMRYSGTWINVADGSASGGSYKASTVTSSSVETTFTGSQADLIGITNGSGGIARVTLDGTEVFFVDLYSPTLAYKQKVWTSGPLVDGTHTLRVECTGTKNESSTGTSVRFDAIDVLGSMSAP